MNSRHNFKKDLKGLLPGPFESEIMITLSALKRQVSTLEAAIKALTHRTTLLYIEKQAASRGDQKQSSRVVAVKKDN